MNKPVFVFAFANNYIEGAQYLRKLPEELRRVRDAMEEAEGQGLCEVVVRPDVTVSELIGTLQDKRYRGRIAFFHFGGHAGWFEILLRGLEGAPSLAHAEGLAELLGQQHSLQVVFLNGCSTEPQVDDLDRAGVPAVIATSEAIDDEVATEFAARFYTAIAAGASVEGAYDEAAAAIKVQQRDVRSALRESARSVVPGAGQWPWTLHVREGAEGVRRWNLPEAAGQPLYGLPPVPEGDLPESPFRRLEWFRAEDAEVFFGRGHEIRELYDRLTTPTGAPVLLYFGESGVGKSSLLAAGLLPRLEATHGVRYLRRIRDAGLAGTLAEALDTDAAEVADAWRRYEEEAGRPLVMILDQAEEVYTRPGEADEMAEFLEMLVALFGRRDARPQGRLVLAFRKEWLADLEARIREAQIPRAHLFLERLDRDGVIEAITGPTQGERLKSHYGLTVEPGLAAIIADDLMEDRESPVAPTLEILLAKMWEKAKSQRPDAPAFTVELYQGLKREGLLLDDFLLEQLVSLQAWNAEAVESGLALDVLAYHTTPLGTAERRSRAEVEETYGHRLDVLPDLLRECQERSILVGFRSTGSDGANAPGTRLAHDTLAPLVRQRFEDSDRPGQRARRILENRSLDWTAGTEGDVLDMSDLRTVEEGQAGMRKCTAIEVQLVAASRAGRRRRQRAERRIRLAGVGALVAIIVLGAVGWLSYQEAAVERDRAQQHADLATASRLATLAPTRAGFDKYGSDRQWLLLARQAYLFNERAGGDLTWMIGGALREALGSRRSTKALPVDGFVTTVAYSADGGSLAVGVANDLSNDSRGVLLWRLESGAIRSHPVHLPVEGWLTALAISADGRALAVADSRGVLLWRFESGGVLSAARRLPIDGYVRSVALSPDGSALAAGVNYTLSRDSADILLWRLEGGAVQSGPETHPIEGGVSSVAFSPSGSALAAGDSRGVLLWRVEAATGWGGPQRLPTEGGVSSVAFSPDGVNLAAGIAYNDTYDDGILLWRLEDATFLRVVERLQVEGLVNAIAFSSNGRALVAGVGDHEGSSGGVLLWPLDGGDLLGLERLPMEDGLGSVTFSADGTYLAARDAAGILLWRFRDGTFRGFVERLPIAGDFRSVVFSPDGTILAAGIDGGVHLWRVAGGVARGRGEHLPVDGIVTSVAFSSDSNILAAGIDGGVHLWRLADGVVRGSGELLSVDGIVISVAFSHAFGTIAAARVAGYQGGDSRDVLYWRVNGGVIQATPERLPTADNVLAVAFSPAGDALAATQSRGVLLWRVDGGVVSSDATHLPAEGAINSLGFSHDGNRIAGGSPRGVFLWKLERGTIQDDAQHIDVEGGVRSVAFDPKSGALAAAALRAEDNSAHLIRLDLRELSDMVCARLDRNLYADEWDLLIGSNIPCEITCPSLPDNCQRLSR